MKFGLSFNFVGRNYLSWLGPQAQLVITEPELVKEVLLNRDKTYPKTGSKDFAKKIVGDGLASIPGGEKWAKKRKLANHAFHGESLKVLEIDEKRDLCELKFYYLFPGKFEIAEYGTSNGGQCSHNARKMEESRRERDRGVRRV